MAEVAGQHIAVAISGQVGEASEQAATELELALLSKLPVVCGRLLTTVVGATRL